MSEYSTILTGVFGLPRMWSESSTGFMFSSPAVYPATACGCGATATLSPRALQYTAPAMSAPAITIAIGTARLFFVWIVDGAVSCFINLEMMLITKKPAIRVRVHAKYANPVLANDRVIDLRLDYAT